MRMTEVSEDTIGDELSFIGTMPKYLPFEIDKRAEKKDTTPKDNTKYFRQR